MEDIIVVDCISSGVNFIRDIINMGYNPVILELKPNTSDIKAYKEKMKLEYGEIDYPYELIYERDSYEETLEFVEKINPLLVIPGSERGVVLANKLAYDLDLLGNPIANLEAMTLKHKMQKKIARAGLRHIRGKRISSIEEAVYYFEVKPFDKVVLKPIYDSNPSNVYVCSNKEEIIENVGLLLSKKDMFGNDITEIIIQEYIDGDEYIINTVSNNGIHRITTIWKYNKVINSDGTYVYDSVESINDLSISEAEMIEYAYDVNDAIGIKYGAVNGEYIIDEKGPVLVEVNCHPMGGHLPSEFLDKISGQHETDSILDSYLKPERFLEKRKERYNFVAHGAFKMFIVPKDLMARSAPIINIAPQLRSHYGTVFEDLIENEKFFSKTKDINTSCGLVFLAHEDASIVNDDLKFLRSVEKNAFDLVLSEELDQKHTINKNVIVEKLKLVIDITEKYGTGILISDQHLFDVDILQVGLEDIENIKGTFDFVLVNLNKSFIERSHNITVDIIFHIFSFIKVGGLIFIPDTTYKYVPGGRKGVEALVKSLNLKIEVPPYGMKNAVIASRTN